MNFRLFHWMAASSVRRWAAFLGAVFVLVAAFWGCRAGYVAWHVSVARTALSHGAAGQALAALRKAEALAPDEPEVLFLLGRSLRRTGALADMQVYLDRALLAGWPEDEVRQQQYLMLMQTGNFDQAGSYLDEVVRKGATDDLAEEIYEARAKGLLSIYDLQEALRCLDYWLKWRPHGRQARMWRAEICQRTSFWNEAISEYRAILEHDSHDFEARLKLADALFSQHDVQGALEEYRKCVAARPDDAPALFGVAKCQQRTGETSDAKSGLLALLKRELSATQKGEVLLELGEMALFNQDYAQAADLLARAREADSTNRFIYQPLSRAYARLGKTELAEQVQRRGDESTRRLSQLVEITDKIVHDQQNPELRYEAGMLLFADGAAKEGAAWLFTALKCDPGHRQTHAALADYYEGIGDANSASRHRKMAADGEHRGNVARFRVRSP
jgi:tetratricopeptide (TPR) repeat protein